MNTRTLFLAWQDNEPDKAWFPIGRLDADVERSWYRFRYIRGARQAKEKVGFPLLIEFPRLDKSYESSELFPLFQNRVMNPARPDFAEYLRNLDLSEGADPIEILATNGGSRVTDAYEVFPKLEKDDDGSFVCRFFLDGWRPACAAGAAGRHVNQSAQERLVGLEPEEELYVTLELTNPATGLAVQIQTENYHMIGWAPRYLVRDLTMAIAESPTKYEASVVRINPQPAPSKQRVLIEMRGRWDTHEPMAGEDFVPLIE